jgi:hypothetical protein
MTKSSKSVEQMLFSFILAANRHLEALDIVPGSFEQTIADLRRYLGDDFLERKLNPDWDIAQLNSGEQAEPLSVWLRSGHVEQHAEEVLEFGSLLNYLSEDGNLQSKIQKLKTDRFWPVYFELAMASRCKRVVEGIGTVRLTDDHHDIGDFHLLVGARKFICECARLETGDAESKQTLDSVIECANKLFSKDTRRVMKIWFKVPLKKRYVSHFHSGILQAAKFCDNDGRVGWVKKDEVEVYCERLHENSERPPHQEEPDSTPTEWDFGMTFSMAEARDSAHLVEMKIQGEVVNLHEFGRLFGKITPDQEMASIFERLDKKLSKKIKQRKLPEGFDGRIIFIEGHYDPELLRILKPDYIANNIANRLSGSEATSGALYVIRESNPQHRNHYSMIGNVNPNAPDAYVTALFSDLGRFETLTDPITNLPYHRSWEAAQKRNQQLRFTDRGFKVKRTIES